MTQIYDRHLEPTGLTITQYGLLSHLRSLDGVSIGALAERLVMDPTTLTRTLGPLVTAGRMVGDYERLLYAPMNADQRR